MDRRLQSLKFQRDLTLGGTKPKKIFTPNINAARNKEKKDVVLKTQDRKKTINRTDLKNNKKGFERSEKFVQSSGIFSDGMGSDALKKVKSERVYTPRDETSKALSAPKLKNKQWQVDSKSEAKVYDNIMGCDSSSEDEDEHFAFTAIDWNENDLKDSQVPISSKQDIKTEPFSEKLNLDKLKLELDRMPRGFQEVNNFNHLEPEISLWKLPDSFAGKGLSDDPNIQTLFDYKLTDLLEGQIGKMKIHRSGRIDVFIGNIKYEIEASHLEAFSEKIVALDSKKENLGTIVLGSVQNRCILNPDWKYLLRDL